MPSTNLPARAVAAAMFIFLSGMGCGSTALNPDGGGGGAGRSGTGAAGTHGGAGSTGAAGATGAAGSTGAAGMHGTGTAGTHGSDGGAGTGAAGKDGGGGCVCADIYAPVCGVDGKTYPSKCSADCAGVAIAHDGACTTSHDASIDAISDATSDAAPGACAQDSDCVYRSSQTCSCTGMCVAKTDPLPTPPKYVCGNVCPAIALACSCVNHHCSALAIGAAP